MRVPLVKSMGRGISAMTFGLVAGGLGSHLDSIQVDNMPMNYDGNEGKRMAVDLMVPVTPSMQRWCIWLTYTRAGVLKYTTSRDHNDSMSWVLHFIMSYLNNSRRRIRSRLVTYAFIMELRELVSILCIKFLLLPVGSLYELEEMNNPVSEGNGYGSPIISYSHPSAAMAPKQKPPSPIPTGQRRPQTRRATKEEVRAAHSVKYFKSNFLPEVQADIEKVDQRVWEETKQGIPDAEFNELAEWIHDPGTTYGRMSLYQREISYFWAAKCISARTAMEQRPNVPKALAPAPLWNLHFNDARLMHKKIDLIAGKLGFQFYAPEVALTPSATPRAASGQDPQSSNAQVP